MRILAKDACATMASCPTVADPEDNSGDLLVVGPRVSGHYPDIVGHGEEMVRVSRELVLKAILTEEEVARLMSGRGAGPFSFDVIAT